MSTKSEQLEWRRSKVVEMRARGMSQIEIAHELQVSKQSISADIAYLRNQAKALGHIVKYNIQNYIRTTFRSIAILVLSLGLLSDQRTLRRYALTDQIDI